jgi:hypothetical protein
LKKTMAFRVHSKAMYIWIGLYFVGSVTVITALLGSIIPTQTVPQDPDISPNDLRNWQSPPIFNLWQGAAVGLSGIALGVFSAFSIVKKAVTNKIIKCFSGVDVDEDGRRLRTTFQESTTLNKKAENLLDCTQKVSNFYQQWIKYKDNQVGKKNLANLQESLEIAISALDDNDILYDEQVMRKSYKSWLLIQPIVDEMRKGLQEKIDKLVIETGELDEVIV